MNTHQTGLRWGPLQARLSRKIAFWVFFSLMLIEIALLIPSYQKREKTLLTEIEELGMATVKPWVSLQALDLSPSELQDLAFDSRFLGATLYQANGEPITSVGEPPQLTFSELGSLPTLKQLYQNGQVYDVAWSPQITGVEDYTVIVRLDTSSVKPAVTAYLWRIMGMIFLITVVVTAGTMIALRTLVLKPILQLRHDLQIAGEAIEQEQPKPTFYTSQLQLKNELGDVVKTFHRMIEQIYQATNTERTLQSVNQDLELRVEERTSLLMASIREAETALAKAEEANLAKSAFLANMSHELRTPLNAIIGYSEMLQEEAEDLGEETLTQDLSKIHRAGKHLMGLINDILDISKIEAGRMELYLETFDLNTVLQDVVTTITPLIEKNNNTLELQYPDTLGTMHADVTKLRQNLFNLFSNAGKFTHNGTITLRVSVIQPEEDFPETPSDDFTDEIAVSAIDWINFEVQDTGIGMSPAQMNLIFDSFAQADVSTTREYGGTGLGLAITRKFCQMLGGEISVESVEGEGTTFSMVLPRQVEQVEDERPNITDQITETTKLPLLTGNGTVLVIDDDVSVGDLLQRSLSRYGYNVQVATSGVEGIALAKTLRPSAITLDVMMPGMDGWAVLSALKGDPDTAGIPVVMLTMIHDQEIGYTLGASDYLVKPINRDQLLKTLHRFRNPEHSNAILIVDDSPINREVLRRQIEIGTQDWTVEEAQDGLQALDLIHIHPPDLILLDLMMPEMDGFQFLVALQERPEWQTIPVVIITAKDLTEDDRKRLNGYVQQVYQKGHYDRQNLINEVQRLLQRVLPDPTHSPSLDA